MGRFTDMFSKAARDELSGLPDDLAARREALTEFHDAARVEMARALEPALNAHLKTLPQDHFREKQAVAKWVNDALRGLGLTIRHPEYDQPALLKANAAGGSLTEGKYFFEITDEKGSRHKGRKSYPTLPDLQLMPADLSRLSHVEQVIARHR